MGFLYDFVHSHWIVRILVILAAIGMLAWSILALVNHFRQAKNEKNADKGTGSLPNLAAERSAALKGLVPKTTGAGTERIDLNQLMGAALRNQAAPNIDDVATDAVRIRPGR